MPALGATALDIATASFGAASEIAAAIAAAGGKRKDDLGNAPSGPPADVTLKPSSKAARVDPAIFSALGDRSLANARAIIDADPRAVNARDSEGRTPLMAIANLQELSIALNSNATGTAVDTTPMGKIPLVAELLVARGAGVNAKSSLGGSTGITALVIALAREKNAFARFLVEHDAAVNIEASDGTTPLHFAAGHGDLDTNRILLKAGAKANARDRTGQTPIFMASQTDMRPSSTCYCRMGRKSI